MKNLKMKLVASLAALLFMGVTNAQDTKQLYTIHLDHVKPSKTLAYEALSKELVAKCKQYKMETGWLTLVTDDFDYFYITPIKNMAELDADPFASLSKKMGADELGKMFSKMDPFYDDHVDYTIALDKELSYMPSGITQTPAGQPYRKNTLYYVAPENYKAAEQLAKDFKALYTKVGSKVNYRVYRSSFGADGTYFMVAIAAASPAAYETATAANNQLLGAKGQELYGRLMSLISKRKIVSGWIRPDLSYTPGK